jgi:Na+/proline symporter
MDFPHSIFEVLERGFSSKAVRLVYAVLHIVTLFNYLGVVLYGPAVALNSVTPLSIDHSILAIGLLCCIYTAFGGIRCVVWTDVFQTCVVLGGQVAILVLGIRYAGGVAKAWERSYVTGRIKLPETRFDFHSRHSFWNMILAPTVEWVRVMGFSQLAIQTIMGLGSIRR